MSSYLNTFRIRKQFINIYLTFFLYTQNDLLLMINYYYSFEFFFHFLFLHHFLNLFPTPLKFELWFIYNFLEICLNNSICLYMCKNRFQSLVKLCLLSASTQWKHFYFSEKIKIKIKTLKTYLFIKCIYTHKQN